MPSPSQKQTALNGLNGLNYPSLQVVVVMVPVPLQGHLNQFIPLSHLIAACGIPVHFAGTAAHNRQAKLQIQRHFNTNNDNMIHFHDFDIPPFLAPPPSAISANTSPTPFLSFHHTIRHLGEPLAALLRQLSSNFRRVIVIHDFLTSSVVHGVGQLPNLESYTLQSVSAFATSIFHARDRKGKVEFDEKDIADLVIPEDIPSVEGSLPPEALRLFASETVFDNLNSGNLYNTSLVIERPYVNLMARVLPHKEHWAIGPLNQVTSTLSAKKDSNGQHMCLEWLDKQTPRSVIYVSFGTTTTFSDEQIKELALGLEESGQKFIWVLRDAEKGDVPSEGRKIELPKGYEERVKNVGLVVRDLAPQLAILGHPSTGGFLSHCGWNSCIESITMGVPIGAWPMHSDQPRNAVFVTAVLGVGTVVRDWNRCDEVAAASAVAEGVRKLMASKEGEAMRMGAAELGAALRDSAAEGGASRMEFASFSAHITR